MEEESLIEIGTKVYAEIPILGGIPISATTVSGWVVIVLVLVFCLVLTRKMEKIPRKKTQIFAEKIVTTLENYVGNTMGDEYRKSHTPYFLALASVSIFGSLLPLIHFKPTTSDLNAILPWTLVTFTLIRINSLKKKGIVRASKGLLAPSPFMLPLNIVEIFTPIISLTFRHFGNILAGTIFMGLIHSGLSGLTKMIFNGLTVPILEIGLPAFASLYFDIFDAGIQAFIFCTLSMVFISKAGTEGH